MNIRDDKEQLPSSPTPTDVKKGSDSRQAAACRSLVCGGYQLRSHTCHPQLLDVPDNVSNKVFNSFEASSADFLAMTLLYVDQQPAQYRGNKAHDLLSVPHPNALEVWQLQFPVFTGFEKGLEQH